MLLDGVQIPAPNATWREIEVFALTFDGYKRIGLRLADEAGMKHIRALLEGIRMRIG